MFASSIMRFLAYLQMAYRLLENRRTISVVSRSQTLLWAPRERRLAVTFRQRVSRSLARTLRIPIALRRRAGKSIEGTTMSDQEVIVLARDDKHKATVNLHGQRYKSCTTL